MDKLRSGKGLSKKRKNLIGGNFNVVENDRLANRNDKLEKNMLKNHEMMMVVVVVCGMRTVFRLRVEISIWYEEDEYFDNKEPTIILIQGPCLMG